MFEDQKITLSQPHIFCLIEERKWNGECCIIGLFVALMLPAYQMTLRVNHP